MLAKLVFRGRHLWAQPAVRYPIQLKKAEESCATLSQELDIESRLRCTPVKMARQKKEIF